MIRRDTIVNAKYVLTLAALCAAPAAIAQDAKTLGDATKVMTNCAAIAKKIAGIPAPSGQNAAAAAAAEQYYEMLKSATQNAGGSANSEQGKAARAKAREEYEKGLKPEQRAFLTQVQAGRDELRKCGQEYQKVNASSEAIVKKLSNSIGAKTTPTEEDKKTGAAVMAYMGAQENLVTEIAALSKDIETQRYVSRVISRFFLGTEKDDGPPAASAAAPSKKK